jgi:XTP/dITP diphosphohydrolase
VSHGPSADGTRDATSRELWIATGNKKKLAELERMLAPLGIRLRTPKELGAPWDPVEDQPDFAGNARVKAQSLALAARGVALADDSGLCVDALGGRPGVHSARYGGEGLDDRGRLLRLLAEIAQVPDAQRTARFRCSLCLCGPDGSVRAVAEGACEGVLLRAPRGDGGFGYDPAFVPVAMLAGRSPEATPTFAELDAAQKDRLSHRGHALRSLVARLADDPALLAR